VALDIGATVVAVDGVEARRELASRLGARVLEPGEASGAIAAETDGLGADVVVEAAGSPGALDAALRLARGRGMVSVVGAHFEPDFPLDNGLMFAKELTMRWSIGDSLRNRPQLISMIAAGRLDPAAVVTHRMALADVDRQCDTRRSAGGARRASDYEEALLPLDRLRAHAPGRRGTAALPVQRELRRTPHRPLLRHCRGRLAGHESRASRAPVRSPALTGALAADHAHAAQCFDRWRT
jgi:hypothetical protein